MRIDWHAAPPGASTLSTAPRIEGAGSPQPAEPQDTLSLSAGEAAETRQGPSAQGLAVRAGTLALAVTAGLAGFAGLAHAAGPLGVPSADRDVPSLSAVVEVPNQTGKALFASSAAKVDTATADSKTVPASVKQLTPEFFKRLGDVGYGYNKIAKGQFVLTFDDGPNPKVTPKILDTLKAHNVKGAVFFVTGHNAELYPELVQRIVAEGHVLGDHTGNHPDLTKLSSAKIMDQLNRTDAAVDKALGYDYPLKLVRPPYGALNSSVLDTIHTKYGGVSVTWNVDSEDWLIQSNLYKGKASTPLATRVLNGVKNIDKQGRGGVILMHDIHPNTGKDLDKVLNTLEGKGFKIVSILEVGKTPAK